MKDGGNVRERVRLRETIVPLGEQLIAHQQNHQVITFAHTQVYFNYRHKALYLYVCVCVCVYVCVMYARCV